MTGTLRSVDPATGDEVARQVQSGAVFVNAVVASDPRLPLTSAPGAALAE